MTPRDSLQALYRTQGAVLANDGIPLHFGDLSAEYGAALESAVLLDRSHEGRIELRGEDRFNLPHRISTNDLLNMQPCEGRATLFLNANARLLDRVEVFNWREEAALLMAGPGRSAPLADYLRRNIFFNDKATLIDLTAQTYQLALHGPQADAIMDVLYPGSDVNPEMHGLWFTVEDVVEVFAVRLKPYHGAHWALICPVEQAEILWSAVLQAGQPYGLKPSGGLVFNVLRIRAGRPGIGRELSSEYIPLEIGLWDEVNFQKGCYTGQEIIARMESRQRLARTIVRLGLKQPVNAGADLLSDDKRVGMVTSAVEAPDGEVFAIAVVRTGFAKPGVILNVNGQQAQVVDLLGVQPAALLEDEE
ncbi:MAG: glycine cleavage system protein T [bacterium]|nr:glycine cleavage system protein T [bacterium]